MARVTPDDIHDLMNMPLGRTQLEMTSRLPRDDDPARAARPASRRRRSKPAAYAIAFMRLPRGGDGRWKVMYAPAADRSCAPPCTSSPPGRNPLRLSRPGESVVLDLATAGVPATVAVDHSLTVASPAPTGSSGEKLQRTSCVAQLAPCRVTCCPAFTYMYARTRYS